MMTRSLFGALLDRKRFYATSPYFLILPLLRVSRTSAIAELRALYCRVFWREVWRFSTASIAQLIAHFVLWPYCFLRAVRRVPSSARAEVHSLTGKGLFRQTTEQFVLATLNSVSPAEYYMYELYLDSRRAQTVDYVIRLAFKPLVYSQLDSHSGYLDLTKRTIRDRCKQLGIASVPVLAHVSMSDIQCIDIESPPFPNEDLFVKPARGRGGKGATVWRTIGSDLWVDGNDMQVTSAQLLSTLRRQSVETNSADGFVVQPRIVNHSAMRGLSGEALSTLRLYTVVTCEGTVEVPYGILRFASVPTSIVDNFHAGGYAAPVVDMESGTIGPATRMGIAHPAERIDVHPSSGAKISGYTLPNWHEVIQLVRGAHHSGGFGRILLGWDVAVTEAGPTVVECNGWADLDIIQRAYQRPIGRDPVIALVLQVLRRSFERVGSI